MKSYAVKSPNPGYKQNLLNKIFGKLKVLEFYGKDKYGNTKWKCICSCGNETYASTYYLNCGRTTSCGCNKFSKGKDNKSWKGYEEISGEFWAHIISSAIKRKILIDITIQDIWDLFLKQKRKCALSGIELKFSTDTKRKNVSLDRIDSSKGYTNGNIQWVHKDINIMKNKFDEKYFIEICKKIGKKHEN